MKWRIVQVTEGDERESDLTSYELFTASVALAQCARIAGHDDSSFERVWKKIQPQVKIAAAE